MKAIRRVRPATPRNLADWKCGSGVCAPAGAAGGGDSMAATTGAERRAAEALLRTGACEPLAAGLRGEFAEPSVLRSPSLGSLRGMAIACASDV